MIVVMFYLVVLIYIEWGFLCFVDCFIVYVEYCVECWV